jgi:cation:H+ antiporter
MNTAAHAEAGADDVRPIVRTGGPGNLGMWIFGALLLAGGLALWQPVGAPRSLQHIEIPALIALAVAIYPMMRSDGELSRREGVILLVAQAIFVFAEVWLAKG